MAGMGPMAGGPMAGGGLAHLLPLILAARGGGAAAQAPAQMHAGMAPQPGMTPGQGPPPQQTSPLMQLLANPQIAAILQAIMHAQPPPAGGAPAGGQRRTTQPVARRSPQAAPAAQTGSTPDLSGFIRMLLSGGAGAPGLSPAGGSAPYTPASLDPAVSARLAAILGL